MLVASDEQTMTARGALANTTLGGIASAMRVFTFKQIEFLAIVVNEGQAQRAVHRRARRSGDAHLERLPRPAIRRRRGSGSR